MLHPTQNSPAPRHPTTAAIFWRARASALLFANVDQRVFLTQRSEQDDCLSADDAAQLLGVKLQTLYAYASRGLVASLPAERGRAKRYRKSDLEQLKTRTEMRSSHGPVTSSAGSRGEPTLESGITLLAAGGPYYRGVSALKLAADGTLFEHVSEWLWESTPIPPAPNPEEEPLEPPSPRTASPAKKGFAGAAAGRVDVAGRAIAALVAGRPAVVTEKPKAVAAPSWPRCDLGTYGQALAALVTAGSHPLSRMALVVPAIAQMDRERMAAPKAAELLRARCLLRRLVAAVALPDLARMEQALAEPTVAAALSVAFGQNPTPQRCQLLDRALVLCADDELNSSTFAARVAASTGADLYACVAAGLATLSGPGHGGECDRVEALIDSVRDREDVPAALRARFERGESVPGFSPGPLPGGDPRTAPLIEGARLTGTSEPRVAMLLALVETMEREGREAPSVETGLVALAFALGLGSGAASALVAIGRCAGWIAHVIEQRKAPRIPPPRARYVGVMPRE